MKKLTIFFTGILIFTIFWLGIIYFAPHDIEETLVDIKEGSSAHQISNLLEANDVITSRLLFNLYIRLNGVDDKLSYGRYIFKGKMTLSQVVNILATGKVELKTLTIPEGLTLMQTSQLLADQGYGDYGEFLALCRDSVFASTLVKMPVRSLEGFLFPETYRLPEEASEEYVLKILVREFKRQTKDLNFQGNTLGIYANLILASIVEKEAHYREEYPIIAGVYLNRINDNHKLEADPTVAYLMARKGINRKKIYYKDLLIDSPYNTYKYTGLPPGPICSPGINAIVSVLKPQDSDYYFFFAADSGRHEFSRTYSEHLRKQNEIKKLNASR
ncbi:MAG: endolytic transglycosylase MltG [Candidatus Cloacimonetes bacterium]|nr:endolytic transglycosylase MltG [Candidatus Cloacimonadota bacterium]